MTDQSMCWYAGETHIQRAKDSGHRVKFGEQRCRFCGSTIEVIEKRKGWALYPPHKKPEAQAYGN